MPQPEPNTQTPRAYIVEADPTDLLERAGIAHELGNLIQIASSAVNIIARHATPEGTSTLDPAISGARASLDRAGALVRQSIHQAARLATNAEHVDVARSLNEVKDLVQYSWAPKYRVEVQSGPGLPPVRCAHPELQGAILNLALNARDSMPDGGVIAIEAAVVFPNCAHAMVELRVSDNGIGMTPETMRRAFDPFFTTKSTGLGGIGLPMVKRFAREAGGKVKLASEPGIGTTVMLRLPAARQAARYSQPGRPGPWHDPTDPSA